MTIWEMLNRGVYITGNVEIVTCFEYTDGSGCYTEETVYEGTFTYNEICEANAGGDYWDKNWWDYYEVFEIEPGKEKTVIFIR